MFVNIVIIPGKTNLGIIVLQEFFVIFTDAKHSGTMKRIILVFLAVISICQLSAQTKRTSVEVDYMEASSRYLEPSQAFMTIPVVADIQVSGKQIIYTERDAFKDYVVTDDLIKLVPNFKQIALCRAARAYKADIILGAMVDVITNADGRFEITITGYPASYVNFRNAQKSDFELIREGKALVMDTNPFFDEARNNAEMIETEIKKH